MDSMQLGFVALVAIVGAAFLIAVDPIAHLAYYLVNHGGK